jgi:hypothetical protein
LWNRPCFWQQVVWQQLAWQPPPQHGEAAQQVAAGTSFSTHFGTIRQQVTVSVYGTHTRTVRVHCTGTSFGTHTVYGHWTWTHSHRVRVHGTVTVLETTLQVVTQ